MTDVPVRQIRAVYDEDRIRVYQAYSSLIADAALARQSFVSPPFKMERMTWIKPSFLWMMYRAGWGYKDKGQERILAIDISRAGFEWALANSCPSHPAPGMDERDWTALKERCPVRVQWDPERDLNLQPLPYRSIQIGLGRAAVELYVSQWILRVTDISSTAHAIHAHLINGRSDEARSLLPEERPYPLKVESERHAYQDVQRID
jgi:hypothetical protein